MLTRQERNAFILLAIVTLAIVAGYILIELAGKSTFSTRFTSTSAEGSLVLLEGKVDQLVVTKNGADLILDVNGTSVFIPASSARGVSLKKGDNIQSVWGCPDIPWRKRNTCPATRGYPPDMMGPFWHQCASEHSILSVR